MTATIRRMRWWDIEALLPTEQALFSDDAWSARTFWSELAGVPETRTTSSPMMRVTIVGYAGMATSADQGDVQTLGVRAGSSGQWPRQTPPG